jgi:DoxX-like family
MKTKKIIYWTTTIIIFLLDGLMPALTSNTELARQGISHLGYPDYFRVMLTFFKITGALILILPVIKGRYKEWVYAGFGINFICAAVSHWAVDGFGGQTIFPLVAFVILATSYVFYHKMNEKRESRAYTVASNSSTVNVSNHVIPGLY